MNVESRITGPADIGPAGSVDGLGDPEIEREAAYRIGSGDAHASVKGAIKSDDSAKHKGSGDDQIETEASRDDHEPDQSDRSTNHCDRAVGSTALDSTGANLRNQCLNLEPKERTYTMRERSLRRSTRSKESHSEIEEIGTGTLSAKDTRLCQQILDSIKKHKCSWPFATPVDPIASAAPGYYDIIKHPMALSTIQAKLKKSHYNTPSDFVADIRLMLENCFTYNPPSNYVYQHGKSLEQHAEAMISKLLFPPKHHVDQEPLEETPQSSEDEVIVSDIDENQTRSKKQRRDSGSVNNSASQPPTESLDPQQHNSTPNSPIEPLNATSFYAKPRQKSTPPPSPLVCDTSVVRDQLSDASETSIVKDDIRHTPDVNEEPPSPTNDDPELQSASSANEITLPHKKTYQKQKKIGAKRSYKSHLMEDNQPLTNLSDGSPEYKNNSLRDDLSIRYSHRRRALRPQYYDDYHAQNDDFDNSSNIHSVDYDFKQNLDLDPLLDVNFAPDANIDDYSYDNNTSDWEYVNDIRSTLASCLKTVNAHMVLLSKRNKRKSHRKLFHAQYSPFYHSSSTHFSSKKSAYDRPSQRYRHSQYSFTPSSKSRATKKFPTKASPRSRSKKRRERQSSRNTSGTYDRLDSGARIFNKKISSSLLSIGTQGKCNPDGTKKICEYCKATETPMWRRGPSGCGTLCNKCGVKWRSGKILEPISGPQPSLLESPAKLVPRDEVSDGNASNSEVRTQPLNNKDIDFNIEEHSNFNDNDNKQTLLNKSDDGNPSIVDDIKISTPQDLDKNLLNTNEPNSISSFDLNTQEGITSPLKNGFESPDNVQIAPLSLHNGDAVKRSLTSESDSELVQQQNNGNNTEYINKITYEQKKELSVLITQLSDENMYQAAEIIRSRLPHLRDIYEDIELDIDAVDDSVLSALYDFVKGLTTTPNNNSIQKNISASLNDNIDPQPSMISKNNNDDTTHHSKMALSASE